MQNKSRRNFLKKSITAFATFSLLPTSLFAIKRRPYATLENVKRARGNIAKREDIFDALCLPENASYFKSAIIGDFSEISDNFETEAAKNSKLSNFCKANPNLRYSARIPQNLDNLKYLTDILSSENCAAISLFITSISDAYLNSIIPILKKASEFKKPVYLFAGDKDGEFSAEIGDMLLAQFVLKLVENGVFKTLTNLKMIIQNSGIFLLLSLANMGGENEDGAFNPFASNIFYLLNCDINEEVFNLIKSVVPYSQFLFASFKDGVNALSRFESLPLSDEQFRRISSENAKLLF